CSWTCYIPPYTALAVTRPWTGRRGTTDDRRSAARRVHVSGRGAVHVGRTRGRVLLPRADGAVRRAARDDAADGAGPQHPRREPGLVPLHPRRTVPMARVVAVPPRRGALRLLRGLAAASGRGVSSAGRRGVVDQRRTAALAQGNSRDHRSARSADPGSAPARG